MLCTVTTKMVFCRNQFVKCEVFIVEGGIRYEGRKRRNSWLKRSRESKKVRSDSLFSDSHHLVRGLDDLQGERGISSGPHIVEAGKLDEQEWGTMKTHVQIGVRVLESNRTLVDRRALQTAINIVADHHERWDGTGILPEKR